MLASEHPQHLCRSLWLGNLCHALFAVISAWTFQMGKPTDGELQAVVDVVQVAEMFAASTPIKVNGIPRQLPNGIDDHPQHSGLMLTHWLPLPVLMSETAHGHKSIGLSTSAALQQPKERRA
jgi:hypothetical protein